MDDRSDDEVNISKDDEVPYYSSTHYKIAYLYIIYFYCNTGIYLTGRYKCQCYKLQQ